MASLSGFQAYADRVIQKRLHSRVHTRVPLLTLLSGKAGSEGAFGRPGTMAILGSAANRARARRQLQDGGEALHIRFQVGTVGGGKYMGVRDTSPTTGLTSQDQKVRTAEFRWCRYKQPVKVWNTTLKLAGGNANKIADAVEEATEMAMEELLEQIGGDIHTGSPTDQTADIWDAPLGIEQICDTDNTYGNVARGTYSNWAGFDTSTAKACKLNLIDEANLTGGVVDRGPPVNTVLTTATNYNTLKQEAMARGAQIVTRGMPEASDVGQLDEFIRYNGTIITYDPKVTASYMECLNLNSLVFVVHPDSNFKVSKFTDQSDVPGGDDAVTANIEVMYMLYSPTAWNNYLFRSVS